MESPISAEIKTNTAKPVRSKAVVKVRRTEITTQERTNGRWLALFYDPTGKRRQIERATELEVLEAAQDMVKEVCSPAAYEQTSAEALLAPYGVSLLEAARFYVTNHGGTVKQISIEEIVEQALARAKQKTGSKNQGYLKNQWRAFQTKFGAKTSISRVTAPEITNWIEAMQDVSERTRRNYVTALVTLFRYAQSKGYFPLERRTPAELVEKPKAEKPGKEIYRPADLKKMLETADDETLPFIALTGLGGVRAEEIVPEDPEEPALTWTDLHWDEENASKPKKWNPLIYVSLEVAKTGEGRYIPIGRRLAKLFKPWRKAEGRIVVNPRLRTYHLSKRIAEASGVPWKKNALRHSYGTYRVAVTNDMPKVALEMGNSVAIVKKHYRKPAKEETAKEWFGIT
jgi:hypothetical protein